MSVQSLCLLFTDKGYIASLMFSYYDRDMNGEIEGDELWEMQVAENLEHISTICTLLDILKYEVQDKKLDHTRFLNAFSKFFYCVPKKNSCCK